MKNLLKTFNPTFNYYKMKNKKSLIKILTEPKNSLIKQYQELFKLEGAKLNFKDNAVREIALKAISKKFF